MRFLAVVALIAACGGSRSAGQGSGPPAIASAFPAARWVPAHPTYVVSAPTVRQGQRALTDLLDAFGPLGDVDAHLFGEEMSHVIAVNPLSAEAVSAIGVDLDGGAALFSEGLNPTFVVKIASPEALQAFFDAQRSKGLVTQSVFIEGTEVFTAQLGGSDRISWAIDHDWLWVHFTLAPHEDEGAAWFAHSHTPGTVGWGESWAWTRAGRSPQAVQGFLDPQALVRIIAADPDVAACKALVDPVRRIAFSIEGDLHHATGQIKIDLGSAATGITNALLPPPPGWHAASAAAPLAAEENLDLRAVATWIDTCPAFLGASLGEKLDGNGLRAGRIMIAAYDPDNRKSWSGAAVVDVTHPKLFEQLLDQLDFPGRSFLEKSRKFGPFPGKRLAPPMMPAIEYSLGEHLVLLGVGDGLLDKIVAPAASAPPPPDVLAFRIQPASLSAKAWTSLLELADVPHAAAFAEHLLAWREGYITVAVSGSDLIVEAGGVRR
jgi:hypothetical protein